MKTWKRLLAAMEVICLCFCGTACKKVSKETSRFGMDLNRLNPLVMTAEDSSTGKTVFSRDTSIISEVIDLFEKMKLTASSGTDNTNGFTFMVSTMSGNFLFGECCGNELKLDGKSYTLDRDYTEDVRLLVDRMKSETASACSVPRAQILKVTADMTYRQIIDLFGATLETAVVGKKKAFLYQYNGRPFYIAFDKKDDTVGTSGAEILKAIWDNYNLGNCLTAPEPLNGEYLSAYEKVFDGLIEQCKKETKTPLTTVMLDTGTLTQLSYADRQTLLKHFKDKYSLKVQDSTAVSMIAAGDSTDGADTGLLVLWINYYTYISSEKMDFVAAARQEGQAAVTVKVQEKAGTAAYTNPV